MNDLVNAARQYLGCKYVWGSEGEILIDGMPTFDCSGLFYRASNDAGYCVKRLTAQGYYNSVGKEVEKTDRKRNDVLFFGTSKNNVTHIAICVDYDTMIESGGGGSANNKNNPGVGVRYNKIRSDLVAVKRITDSGSVTGGVWKMSFDVGLVKYGSKNNDVLLLQEILKARGYYSGNLDKDFGSGTLNALKKYQEERISAGADMGCGSVPDGECGEKTWSDLLAT